MAKSSDLSKTHSLNLETIEAMFEAERIAHDPSVKSYTNIEELFKDLNSDIDDEDYCVPFEFINDKVYDLSPPGLEHQAILNNLLSINQHLSNSKYDSKLHANINIYLIKSNLPPNKVIPDLVLLPKGFDGTAYNGVPELIIEIVDPTTNGSHEYVTKINLYMQHGVKEYWIVLPKLQALLMYGPDENGFYEMIGAWKYDGFVESQILRDLSLNLADIFLT